MSGDSPRTEVGRRRPQAAERATPEALPRETGPGNPDLPFGGHIARYRLIEVLGQGGMGTVYLAEQTEPVTRHVALKLMRSPFGTAADLARFEGEREALARLTHPSIAQLYEAGTLQGTPWFAMELARGQPLTEYCDLARLPLRDRLRLFVEVCRGVQFAHQRGIIHRDLKPSNVLVSTTTGAPAVKIIDFGIAKALDRPLSDATLLTVHSIVGTPGYMSPETLNAGPAGGDVDTRTDVYALGVILFELICGRRPFDDEALGFGELVRVVTSEDSPRPSQRFRTADEPEREEVASRRRLAPAPLLRELSGDLDLIARKAVSRERGERYGSVADLAADVERLLADEPIAARPPSIPYRLRKFGRRHRLAVSLATLLAAAILVAIVGILVQSARARRNDERASAVAAFLKSTLDSADPWESHGSGFTVREMLDQAVPRLRLELADRPEVRAELLETIGSVYFQLGELGKAEPLFRDCLEIQTRRFGDDGVEVAAALHDLALTLPSSRRRESASMLRRVIEIRTRVRGPEHPSVARTMHDLSSMVDTDEESERLLREGLRIRLKTGGDLGFSLRGLGSFLVARGRLAEAQPYLERAHTSATPGRLQRERAAYYLGALRLAQERWAEAEPLFREALEISERVRGPADAKLGEIVWGLGIALREGGRLVEAERELHRALATFRTVEEGAPGELTAMGLTDLGLVSLRMGKVSAARDRLEQALAIWNVHPGRPRAAWTYEGLGDVSRESGDPSGAEEQHRRALAIREASYPEGHPEIRRSRALVGAFTSRPQPGP